MKNWPLAIAVLCLLGATACLFEAGDRIELVRVSSPGGRLDAVVTLTPGSAISRPTAQVSIVPADAPVTSFGNVYVAGSDLSLQPVWRADDSLLVIASNNLDGGPVQQEVEGVAVAVLALTSIDDTASEARAFSTLQLKATAQCVIQLWRDGWNAESLFALPYPPLDHEQGRRLHYLAQDAWGEKLMLTVKGDSFTVASAGADGRPDTEDDLGLTFRR